MKNIILTLLTHFAFHHNMDRMKRIWYLSPMRAAKVQASLRIRVSAQSRQNLRCSLIQAVSQEEPSDRKPDPWPLWMAGHAQLNLVMTECSKTQIRSTGLISLLTNLFPQKNLNTASQTYKSKP